MYSTHNTERELVFQGVARLVTHKHDKKTVQNVGYLGEGKGAAMRGGKQFPALFKRRDFGADIYILGYDANQSWREDLKFSVLENFWMAILKEKLVVVVDGEKIDADSLPRLMKEFSVKNAAFKAHHYYNAVTSPEKITKTETLGNLGDVEVYLIQGSAELPKRIAMIRGTGMTIFEKAYRSISNFAGVFYCDNEKGNSKLREMEPPRHDAWDKDRPEPGVNRKTWKELDDWLRDSVRSLKPADISKVTEIPDLYKYLPDIEEQENTKTQSKPNEETPENPDKKPLEKIPFTLKPVKAEPRPRPTPNPDPTRIALTSRVFLTEEATGTYRAVLNAEKSGTAALRISAVGDDAQPVLIKAVKAWTDDGGKLEIDDKGIIKQLNFTAGQEKKIYIQIDSATRLSLEVSANED